MCDYNKKKQEYSHIVHLCSCM